MELTPLMEHKYLGLFLLSETDQKSVHILFPSIIQYLVPTCTRETTPGPQV